MSSPLHLPRHAPRSAKLQLKRQRRWRALRAVGAVGVIACGAWQAVTAAAEAPWFTVSDVVVIGSDRVPGGDLAEMADDLKGRNILVADIAGWCRRMLAWSWVAEVSVRRRLPSTIEVFIVERQPIGIARFGAELLLVDASAVIDQFQPAYAQFDLPIIDGLLIGGPSGRGVDTERGWLVLRLLHDVQRRPRIAARISQIDVTDPADVRVVLAGDPAVLRVGASDFLERLERYTRNEPAIRERWPSIDHADLRFGDRVYVAPAPVPPR